MTMKIILVLSAIFFVTAARNVNNGTSCQCGEIYEARIIHGVEAGENEFPWMVAVYLRYFKFGKWVFNCGGSIITPWHVLTAAHCIPDYATLGILIGYHDLEEGNNFSEINIIEKSFVHEKYSPDVNYSNDIAVLVTTRKMEFSLLIVPVCLPNKKLKLDHEIVEVMGWGRTENNEGSDRLLKLKQKVLPLGKCNETEDGIVNLSHICGRSINGTTCSGDSGGPLVWENPENARYTQVGLVSFGDIGCPIDEITVYTRVSYFIDWINKIVAETKPDVSICTGY